MVAVPSEMTPGRLVGSSLGKFFECGSLSLVQGGWATDINTGVNTYVDDPEYLLTQGYLFAGSTVYTSKLPVAVAPAPVRVDFYIPFRVTVDPVWNGFRLTIQLFEVQPRFRPLWAPPAPATLPGPIGNGLNSIGTHRFTVQPYTFGVPVPIKRGWNRMCIKIPMAL